MQQPTVTRDLPLEMVEVETLHPKINPSPVKAGVRADFARGVSFSTECDLVPSARVAHIGSIETHI
jgi:hypothetical protein